MNRTTLRKMDINQLSIIDGPAMHVHPAKVESSSGKPQSGWAMPKFTHHHLAMQFATANRHVHWSTINEEKMDLGV